MYLKKFTSTIVPFLLVASAWAGTLTDDFSDWNMDEWTQEGYGVWHIDNGELVLESGSLGFAIGEPTWENYTVSVKLKIAEHRPTDGVVQGAGFLLRYVNQSNRYVFCLGTLSQSPKQVQTYYIKAPSTFVQHFVSKLFEWELNTWYDLKSIVEGNIFKHYVNGELILEYADNMFPTGRVGIGVGVST